MQLPPIETWPGIGVADRGHHHPRHQHWTRRRFVQTATGLTAVSAAIGTGLLRPRGLLADSSVPPMPISGGSPAIAQLAGQLFHVYGPGPEGADFAIDPPDAEPSTITDFNGDVGLAYISGMVRRTNRATGEVRELPFINNDMRYMAGAYRGVDGQVHEGTFAFI
jgi:hypothetical protein